jgi:putative endonuclease
MGKKGEELAAGLLERKGYLILEKRYRYGQNEIDIIASDNRTLVFVEVKSRSRQDALPPYLSVDNRKQNRILKVAKAYLVSHPLSEGTEVRFDVISVIISPGGKHNVEHMMDAFKPF